MKTPLLIFLLFFGISTLNAQETSKTKPKKRHFLRFNHHLGYVLQTNDFVKGVNASDKPYQFFEASSLEFGKQTTGERLWERLYDLPIYGIGLYTLDFDEGSRELGIPGAIYGFLIGPIKRFPRSGLNFEIGAGFSYNWNPFDKNANPFNKAIGSGNNVYLSGGLHYVWYLSQRWALDAGLMFTHFSNGSTTAPNAGINLVSPKIGLKYNFNKSPLDRTDLTIPVYDPEHEVYVSASFGIRNIKPDSVNTKFNQAEVDKYFPMGNLSVFYQRQLSWKLKLGAGIDFNYDGAVEADIDLFDGVWDETPLKTMEKMSIGILGSLEWVIGDLSVIVQPGFEVMRKEIQGRQPRFYQRLGLKYHIAPNTFMGINIRALNFSRARFIEWNLGYRIKWRKHKN